MKKQSQQGFSLIELLVAMAVFLTVLLVATDIFVSVSRREQQTLVHQRALNELRYDFYFLTQQAKINQINYEMYPLELNIVETQLFLQDKNEKATIFKLSNQGCNAGVKQCLLYFKEGVGWKTLSSSAIDFDFMKFYITPNKNPFDLNKITGKYAADDQPKVTIVLQAFAPNQPDRKINLQTTVSSRIYGR
ncbi:prepilin-type N-terminal cleavage/methylation domain-containing protein [Candidatus Falkowbacteria bacterium]|nr:prepilin-type N-terminal cleavage/methylation domain-containing protein [Candidatus Falkowbacteria bacterium]